MSRAQPPAPPSRAAPAARQVPGVVIAHSPAESRLYLGSPALARLPDGELLVSHDLFGPASTCRVTRVYGSTDGGSRWEFRAELDGQWWSSLFVHRGTLYLLGTSEEYGHVVIRRSRDAGRTWTTPTDGLLGLLAAGRFHCAPVPVLEHRGRLWRAMEDAMGPDSWPVHFRARVLSVPVDADLLIAEHWTLSEPLAPSGPGVRGWLEGNMVAVPGGDPVLLLRVDSADPCERAAVVRVDPSGCRLHFDPATDLVPFPGGSKKFVIRPDPHGSGYLALANPLDGPPGSDHPALIRNTLALVHSPDLRTWTQRATLLHHPDRARHAFQYPDWLVDGEDLLAVLRTAFEDGLGGAHNQHDSNYITFHRFPGACAPRTGC